MVGRKKKTKICDKGSNQGSHEDMISQLPDHLISHILTHLSTKDAIRTSVLSTKWRILWQSVRGLDLNSRDFRFLSGFVSFAQRVFDSHKDSWIQKLCLSIHDPDGNSYLTSWIDDVITRKIQHLDVRCEYFYKAEAVKIPLNLYTCETLVHLRLCRVALDNAEFVSLSCLKIMHLECNHYPNEATLEKLISGSPVLQDLTIIRAPSDNLKVLQVRSQTLKIVDINQFIQYDEQLGVVIDAPLLQFLRIKAYLTYNFKIINIGLTPKVDIAVSFGVLSVLDPNDLSKISMVRNFLTGISRVRGLVISHDTAKVIFQFKKLEPQLQFCYLSQLSARFSNSDLKMLPTVLKSCPKLKSLILELVDRPRKNREPKLTFSFVPPCLVSSLRFVELKSPVLGYEGEIKLVRYFLKNSRILERMSLRFENYYRKKAKHVILQQLLAIPRCSSACEVVLL